jgi:hypothetical protein
MYSSSTLSELSFALTIYVTPRVAAVVYMFTTAMLKLVATRRSIPTTFRASIISCQLW